MGSPTAYRTPASNGIFLHGYAERTSGGWKSGLFQPQALARVPRAAADQTGVSQPLIAVSGADRHGATLARAAPDAHMQADPPHLARQGARSRHRTRDRDFLQRARPLRRFIDAFGDARRVELLQQPEKPSPTTKRDARRLPDRRAQARVVCPGAAPRPPPSAFLRGDRQRFGTGRRPFLARRCGDRSVSAPLSSPAQARILEPARAELPPAADTRHRHASKLTSDRPKGTDCALLAARPCNQLPRLVEQHRHAASDRNP